MVMAVVTTFFKMVVFSVVEMTLLVVFVLIGCFVGFSSEMGTMLETMLVSLHSESHPFFPGLVAMSVVPMVLVVTHVVSMVSVASVVSMTSMVSMVLSRLETSDQAVIEPFELAQYTLDFLLFSFQRVLTIFFESVDSFSPVFSVSLHVVMVVVLVMASQPLFFLVVVVEAMLMLMDNLFDVIFIERFSLTLLSIDLSHIDQVLLFHFEFLLFLFKRF